MTKSHNLILAWVRENGSQKTWLLDLLRHLTDNGVPMDEAVAELERFVDDAILLKLLMRCGGRNNTDKNPDIV